MKKYCSPSLLSISFLFGSETTHAQYRFDNWTADNGLPQNTIRDLVQTRDGYLWPATFDGLVRFVAKKKYVEAFRQYSAAYQKLVPAN